MVGYWIHMCGNVAAVANTTVGSHTTLSGTTMGMSGHQSRPLCPVCVAAQDGEVVAGVLGCPNLPQGLVGDEDGYTGSASRLLEAEGTGTLFLAER